MSAAASWRVSAVVVDTSAVLAFLGEEPGAERFAEVLGNAAISAVNVAEAATILHRRGGSREDIDVVLSSLALTIVDFDRRQAVTTGLLKELGRQRGLSLGDRACLALAIVMKVPVLTADRAWARADFGVEVRLVR
ncbi:MAG: PIN domain-containing protein [Alphaproteobacteria bacterium]|nr:PIN domain-containing protein [Alphaproteobacteria bacterium]